MPGILIRRLPVLLRYFFLSDKGPEATALPVFLNSRWPPQAKLWDSTLLFNPVQPSGTIIGHWVLTSPLGIRA